MGWNKEKFNKTARDTQNKLIASGILAISLSVPHNAQAQEKDFFQAVIGGFKSTVKNIDNALYDTKYALEKVGNKMGVNIEFSGGFMDDKDTRGKSYINNATSIDKRQEDSNVYFPISELPNAKSFSLEDLKEYDKSIKTKSKEFEENQIKEVKNIKTAENKALNTQEESIFRGL